MDKQAPLHSELLSQQITRPRADAPAIGLGTRALSTALFVVLLLLTASLRGQSPARPNTSQELVFSGLLTVSNQGQFNAVKSDAAGDLYLLLDEHDGIRILKTDPTATTVLAQSHIGTKFDTGLAMALDPAGNVFITGTSGSTTLAGTTGAAFPNSNGTTTNGFVARFDSSLNLVWLSFTGSTETVAQSISATADSVFITGSLFTSTLPVTPSGIIQAPAFGTNQNGFVERFSSDGSTLVYATYLSGFGGNTIPSGIVADASDNAYIVGATSASGYPTLNALVPRILPANTTGVSSGFLTRLNPTGSGILFSTFIPGGGLSSVALDPIAGDLLLSGTIALGEFPVTSAPAPLIATPYQVVARLALDGSAVLSSTPVAPAAAGASSFVTPGLAGSVWLDGALTLPLLPLTPLGSYGNSFAAHILAPDSSGETAIDQTARFGGLPLSNASFTSLPLSLSGITTDSVGNAIVAGTARPTASSSLLSRAAFDLPLTAASAVLPSSIAETLPSSTTCTNSSLCSGSAAFLSKLSTMGGAALTLSAGSAPVVTVRNLGSAESTGLSVSATGFTLAGDCGSTLGAGDTCSLLLSGSGPGTVTVQAANATTQTLAVPSFTASGDLVLSQREMDFGVATSASPALTRTVTVTNLGSQAVSFASALDATLNPRNPVAAPFSQSATDCPTASQANSYQLPPGASCQITLTFTASSDPSADGILTANWLIGTLDLALTGYSQAASLSLSATEIDFGLQFVGGLHPARTVYVSNNANVAVAHTAVTLPSGSPFTATDLCPRLLEPATVCPIQLNYHAAKSTSTDSVTLTLDQGLTVLVTGETLPQPTAIAAAANPNLTVSPASVAFLNQVVTTSVSSETQTITVTNTGATAFSLSTTVTGDFTQATDCGTTLAGGGHCTTILQFVPSQPGVRQGLFSATAGSGTSPAYVVISGVALPILAPANGSTNTANNGVIRFGDIPVGQPSTQWVKITQSFPKLTAAVNNPDFTVILVEDIGYGHGQPPATAFGSSFTGSCTNCWLGVTSKPSAVGAETASLALTSTAAGSAYALTLTATGLPLTGVLLDPLSADFGPVAIGSSSGSTVYSLTNQTFAPVMVNPPVLTGSFSLSAATSGGPACSGALAPSASCFVEVAFSPATAGPQSGTLTLTTSAGTTSAALTGYGLANPGIAFSPATVNFANVPGTSATSQTITVSNTGSSSLQIGTPTSVSSFFSASSNCATLDPGRLCTINVNFVPQTSEVSDTLSVPVTSSIGGNTSVSTQIVPLSSSYTTEDSGLQIVEAGTTYGPSATSQTGLSRHFILNNLTAQPLDVQLALPRQFVLTGPPCLSLAANGSCAVAITFLPLTNGDVTGTLFAQATPTGGSVSPTLNGIGYAEGYGTGDGSLSITGSLSPGGLLDFGQVASGQSANQTLTLTNTGQGSQPNAPVTIRRITSAAPFLSTTTCSATLAVNQTCTVTITYSPLNQVALGSPSPATTSDAGTLVVESDAITSPDIIDLTGSGAAVGVSAPTNTAALAAYTASQGSLTFARTAVGDRSQPQTVDLTNTGTATIHILRLVTTPDFSVQSPCSTLIPGQSCTLTIYFNPQSAGSRIGALEIASDSSTSLDFISLIGGATPSIVSLSASSLDFGSVVHGQSITLPITILNSGTGATTLDAIQATGDYTAISNCPPPGGSLAGNTSCTAQVTFAPKQTGLRAGTFSVSTSSSTLPITAALTGNGIQSQLTIAPTALDFGSIVVGASANLSLKLTNSGTAPMLNLQLTISGDYAITQTCGTTQLAPGASCTVTLTFLPSAAGVRTGALSAASSATVTPTVVPLTGTGVQNGGLQLTVAAASGGPTSSSATVTVTSGNPAAYSLTVTPLSGFTGTVVLTCTPIGAVLYAACSLLPSSIQLSAGVAQNAAATINTITSVASTTASAAHGAGQPAGRASETGDHALALLCVLLPGLMGLGSLATRRDRLRKLTRLGLLIWMLVAAALLLTTGGCGGGVAMNPALRYTPAGTYQYQVTASSTSGVQLTRSVQLTLIVK